ncbi:MULTISPECIES: chemotaxis protein CheW [Salinibaculum]|uniref:chemotaxis protein CheW n=1 Tax=Salinibaculum TaxID=2732368 RepID=UPI0030D4E7AF
MATADVDVAVPDQVLVFTLGEDRFCVAIDAIDEIVTAGEVSPVPDTPRMVEGVMNLRGETTTIVDPKVVYGLAQTDADRRVIIYDGDGDGKVGWLVDDVHQVGELRDPEVDPAPDSEYVEGIVKQDGEFTLWVEPARVNGRLGE